MTPAANISRGPGLPLMGLPLLALAQDVAGPAVARFDDADRLALRLHEMRRGRGLDCRPGHASINGAEEQPGVMVWATPRDADPVFLAFAAGPGAASSADLLAALARTRVGGPTRNPN